MKNMDNETGVSKRFADQGKIEAQNVKFKEGELEALEALTNRVENLEAEVIEDRNAFMRQVSAYGGVAALLISIGVGLVTLADRFHFDRLRTIESQKSELDDIVGRLTEINWSLLEIANSPNADTVIDFQHLSNGEKAALIERASVLVKDLDEEITFAVATVLAFESLNFSDYVNAGRYSEIAIQTAPSEGFRIGAVVDLAGTYLAPGTRSDLSYARELFRNAITSANAMPAGTGINTSLSAYMDWAAGEAMFGECSVAQGLVVEASELMNGLLNETALKSLFFDTLTRRLVQSGSTHCVLEPS